MLTLLPHRERERNQLMTEIGMLHGYIGIIMDELKAHRLPVPPTSHIPSKDPLIQRNEPKYVPVPLGPTDS